MLTDGADDGVFLQAAAADLSFQHRADFLAEHILVTIANPAIAPHQGHHYQSDIKKSTRPADAGDHVQGDAAPKATN